MSRGRIAPAGRPRPVFLFLCTLLAALATTSPVAAAADDNEAAEAFPHGSFAADCTMCHVAESWTPARISDSFDHRKLSGFALRGAHGATSCRACHASLDFASAPADCASCHQDAHRGELGVDCGQCHSTRSFIDRSEQIRGHRFTRFPLNGSHVTVDCESCHSRTSPGIQTWVGTPTDCEACHLQEYFTTTDPNHATAGFPTDCAQCHTARSWQRAVIDHDGFPIYSGKHKNRWDTCSDCHTTPGNFMAFSCLGCHPHSDQSKTDGDHDGVSGYSYDSQACFSCHPSGDD